MDDPNLLENQGARRAGDKGNSEDDRHAQDSSHAESDTEDGEAPVLGQSRSQVPRA